MIFVNIFPSRQLITFIHGKNLVKFLRCEYLKCIWITFSWVIINYFNTFSCCICNSIAFCQVFWIQIHLRLVISISGYSKISINCRVPSTTIKKLIWCDAATSACTPPPATFVTTLMRGMNCERKSNRAGSRFRQWLRAKFWRQHWSPHSRHESMHELRAVCHPLNEEYKFNV